MPFPSWTPLQSNLINSNSRCYTKRSKREIFLELRYFLEPLLHWQYIHLITQYNTNSKWTNVADIIVVLWFTGVINLLRLLPKEGFFNAVLPQTAYYRKKDKRKDVACLYLFFVFQLQRLRRQASFFLTELELSCVPWQEFEVSGFYVHWNICHSDGTWDPVPTNKIWWYSWSPWHM